MRTADFVVVGAGVMGVNIACELRRRHPDASVRVLEKEASAGQHASGRNSGVLHAGFYYTADSLKARFTRIGNRLMQEYCEHRRLRVHRCGKLVVARNESELPVLDELLRRGRANGVPLQEVSEREAREIEPRVKTFQRALFSPSTATVDPAEVMRCLVEDARHLGVEILLQCEYRSRRGRRLFTSQGELEFGYLVNAAGLQADRIAQDFGFSERYRILPFKGLYLYSSEPPGSFRTNIYPVPNIRNPFLGVHFTVTSDGRAKLGPTAIPCLWREQYDWTSNFKLSEFGQAVGTGLSLLLHAGFDFRQLAWEEVRKYHRPAMVAQAAQLAEGVRVEHFTRWGRPGIRAQLVDIRLRTLVQDFCIEHDDQSLHVLNAVSPGWTCSIPFSQFVCDHVEGRVQAVAGH